MKYVKVTDGVATEYSLNELRKDNPNVSFPKVPTEETLAEYGVHPVSELPRPKADVVEKGPIVNINGAWVQTWAERPYTDAEKRSRMACTPRQARLALSQTGRYGAVKQFMAQLPAEQKEQAEIEWEYATAFERTSGLLVTLTAAMGMTEQEVDDLFNLAVTL